ncbi:hypothetical protein [Ekhidna sp.]
MKTSMFEYSKVILEKVSFNKNLFWKEYRKFKQLLPDRESLELRNWAKQFIEIK